MVLKAPLRRLGLLLAVCLIATIWTPSKAVRGKQAEEQSHRELFGERIYSARAVRGGAGGAAKAYQEFIPMRTRREPPETTGPTFVSSVLPGAAPSDIPMKLPSATPSFSPSDAPIDTTSPAASSNSPSVLPSVGPTQTKSASPSSSPSVSQSMSPSASPSMNPSVPQSMSPSASPSMNPSGQGGTLRLGLLNKVENGLLLSEGLSSRIIATSGQPVSYGTQNNGISQTSFHARPAGGGTFEEKQGGWIYLSGKDAENGGVGAITFDASGSVVKYEMIFEGTSFNSNGGRTPWDTWVTGERDIQALKGKVYQVDPYGNHTAALIEAITQDGGAWGGFSYDIRNRANPKFFMSENFVFGAIRKFTPTSPDWSDPWSMLLGKGTTEYLLLNPSGGGSNSTTGTFSWSNEIMIARGNAARNYPGSQGIDVNGNILSFVCKEVQRLYQLNLDDMTYTMASTKVGLLDGEPNEIAYVVGDKSVGGQTLLYITETGGRRAGVHARTQSGSLYTVLEGFYEPDVAGFALSPNGMHMYLSFKDAGVLFDIEREDGLSFHDKILLNNSGEVRNKMYVKARNDN